MSKVRHTRICSPIGELVLIASEKGLRGVYMEEHSKPPCELGKRDGHFPILLETSAQLGEYFSGTRKTFGLSLDLIGTAFQLAAWEALLKIPHGQTRSYGEQAAMIDNAKAVRAIGLANGRNPVSIIVPCHRVIGKNGTLTGYGGGLERKRFLLELEQRVRLSEG